MAVEPTDTTEPSAREGPWKGSFEIDGTDGGPIQLSQVEAQSFELKSKIYYRGTTGLEDKGLGSEVLEDIRTLDPAGEEDGVFKTDLASVPGLARWFLGTYGVHTPAVLIHDRLVPTPSRLEGMSEQYADRYLRFMLQALEMRWLKRWVMWTAVALRTRWAARGWRRVSVVVWVLASIAGMTTLIVGLVNGSAPLIVAAVFAPALFAALWGKQFVAGLIAAVAAPWFLPPTLLAALGYFVYLIFERLFAAILGDRSGTGSYRPDGI